MTREKPCCITQHQNCITRHHRTSQRIAGHHNASQGIAAHRRTSQHITGHHKVSQRITVHHKTPQHISRHHSASQLSTAQYKAPRVSKETSWVSIWRPAVACSLCCLEATDLTYASGPIQGITAHLRTLQGITAHHNASQDTTTHFKTSQCITDHHFLCKSAEEESMQSEQM